MSKSLTGIIEAQEENYKISSNEKVQIARETNRLRLPREIKKWLQSLDLSYKIKFISKDLANGFCVAEILSRYPVPFVTNLPYPVTHFYRVNVQEFSNGISYKERLTNWKHITDILRRKYQMQFPEDLPGRVLSYAPNAAFEFLCMLYSFLTKKELTVLNKVDETDKFSNYAELELLPPYMRPTANKLVRDKETQRIEDDLTRKMKIENILQNHNKYLAVERENFAKMDQFYRSQKIKLKKIDPNTIGSKLSSAAKVDKQGTIPAQSEFEGNEAENDTQNNLGGGEGLKEDHINLLGILAEISEDSREQDNILNEFKLLIRKNFVETDRNIEMDLKNYPNDKDILEYFFEKIHLCSEENLSKIFAAYEDKQKEFVSIISRALIELDPFIKIVCDFYEALYKNGFQMKKFKNTTVAICNCVKDITKDKCDNIFLNFCIDYLLDMIEKNPLYRNEMCEIIFGLTLNTSESNMAILKKVSKHFLHKNEVLFYHVLIPCLENIRESDDVMNSELFLFYSNAVIKGLNSADETINIKAMYLANQLMRFDFYLCLQYHRDIFKHSSSFNWEILSLILIYCSQMLKLHNHQKLEKDRILGGVNMSEVNVDARQSSEGIDINESAAKENQSLLEKMDGKNGESLGEGKRNEGREGEGGDVNQSQAQIGLKENSNIEQNNENIDNLPSHNQESPDKNNIEAMENIENIDPNENERIDDAKRAQEEYLMKIEEVGKREETILKNIEKIFTPSSPHMTLKIGFIYLSEVIEYYPQLAEKYIKLLIEYKDNKIRKDVLSVTKAGEENEYTINCFTEKYRFCGAPCLWNQLVVAGIFRDYVLNEKLERFEATHLTILKSIIINQEFDEEKSEEWIGLYDDLKNLLFDALCEKEFSTTALEILIKLFDFNLILNQLLESTFDLFISTMKTIYGDDVIDAPHENMKKLLSFVSGLNTEKGSCKGYIYKLIKTFAIENDKKYIKSNLVDLMNEISNEKRGKIFE